MVEDCPVCNAKKCYEEHFLMHMASSLFEIERELRGLNRKIKRLNFDVNAEVLGR